MHMVMRRDNPHLVRRSVVIISFVGAVWHAYLAERKFAAPCVRRAAARVLATFHDNSTASKSGKKWAKAVYAPASAAAAAAAALPLPAGLSESDGDSYDTSSTALCSSSDDQADDFRSIPIPLSGDEGGGGLSWQGARQWHGRNANGQLVP